LTKSPTSKVKGEEESPEQWRSKGREIAGIKGVWRAPGAGQFLQFFNKNNIIFYA